MLKDDVLVELSKEYNVARFVSLGPAGELRHACIDAGRAWEGSTESAIKTLLIRAGSVNVRSFLPRRTKGNPFYYGLTKIEDVLAETRKLTQLGYYCIVNETINVDDGGVSGVVDANVVEISPDDTPRAVEKPGVCTLPLEIAQDVLSRVYGLRRPVPEPRERRIEFSIHPTPVGLSSTNTLIWEVGPGELEGVRPSVHWPNNFSRHIGDKTFGLVLADVLGLNVPETTVVGRRVAPFRIGRSTGEKAVWLRTAPREPRPGKFSTVFGWRDPFELVNREDPEGTEIQAVLAQCSVRTAFSGATYPQADGEYVEGVSGRGDAFMSGVTPPEPLPAQVIDDVSFAARHASDRLGSRIRMEWVHDGRSVWVVQMHLVRETTDDTTVITPGHAEEWIPFDPTSGLSALETSISEARLRGAGIIVTARVGLTSHIGDVLRRAEIPSRFGRA